MLLQIHANKMGLNNFAVTMVKNGCGQSGKRILKLTVLQK